LPLLRVMAANHHGMKDTRLEVWTRGYLLLIANLSIIRGGDALHQVITSRCTASLNSLKRQSRQHVLSALSGMLAA
ncbi:MAG: hypothetical protein Q7J20_00975, partial [Candidatus Nitrotoga sp.]|nr:hypothetical protein [Candidatus Nitrotoga sp.]